MSNWFHKLQDNVGIDRIAHFMGGFCVAALFSGFNVMLTVCGAFAAMIVGVTKEIALDDKFDGQDVVATFIGGLIGAAVFAAREALMGF